MSWGVRERGGLRPVDRPERVDVARDERLSKHPDVKDLRDAIDTAHASQLPGTPTQLIKTISLFGYEPPQGALDSALGS